jgi:transposase
MFDINDDAKSSYRRVEVLTGPGRRRHWSAEEKARAVAETLAPGARVSDVARRWQICPQQVYTWRRTMRSDVGAAVGASSGYSAPPFVPIVTEAVPAATAAGPRSTTAVIEIQLAGAVVRVTPGLEGGLLTAVLRAVRASASPP